MGVGVRRSFVGSFMALALAGLSGCGSSEHNPGGSVTAVGGAESTGGSNGSAGLGVNVGNAGDGPGCERQVTLQAVKLGEPAPFDLVIVADHSMSLSWSKDELSKGLQDLLTNVQGRQVRIFLLTPTQYGKSSSAAHMPLTGTAVVPWQDPATGNAYEDAVTEYSQYCTGAGDAVIECPDAKSKTPYKARGKWTFRMPEPIATLSPEMSSAEFAAQASAVREAILAIGGTGAPQEQPLCTLARYISQPADFLPKNAVFLLITDEDDVSTPDDCMASFDSELELYRVEQGSTACSSGCDVYRYSMPASRRWQREPFTCAAFTDTGTRIAGTDKSSWYNSGEACSGVLGGSCTDAERATIEQFCDSGLKLTECTHECATQDAPCSVDLPDASIDACSSSFSYNGKTWANLAAYCAGQGGSGACSGGGLTLDYAESYGGSYSHVNVTPGTTNTLDLATYFKNKAGQAFGARNYLLEGIVLDPTFSCTLGSGQSYAHNLAQFIGDRSHLYPLCESYAPALDGVLGFAQTLIQTEFTLELADDEHVSDIVVLSDEGVERKLVSTGYRFDAATSTLHIEPAAITATDASLRVEITSACRPIVK